MRRIKFDLVFLYKLLYASYDLNIPNFVNFANFPTGKGDNGLKLITPRFNFRIRQNVYSAEVVKI